MIKCMTRSAALFVAGVLLAGGAWGQARLDQNSSPNDKYAAELFGAQEGREILTAATVPFISLAPVDGNIGGGNKADITYTLNGATFSATVGTNNLLLRSTCDDSNTGQDGLAASVTSGGAKGDSTVTFSVETVGTGSDSISGGELICFLVPNIQATLTTISEATADAPVSGVSVSVAIKPTVSSSNPFPSDITGGPPAGTPPVVPKVTMAQKAILEVAPATEVSLGTGDTAEVAVTKRMVIATGGTRDPSATNPATAAMGVKVGAVTIGSAQDSHADELAVLDLNGGTVYTGLDPANTSTRATGFGTALGGKVLITVSGPFQAGDMVVYGTKAMAPEDGKASFSEPLAFIAEAAAKSIVYVPGGTAALKPSMFTATAKYDFNDADNNNATKVKSSAATIKYQGVTGEGYAHGVVKAGGADTSFLRVRCAMATAPATACTVFADCSDQAGTPYFGELGSVNAGATDVFSSDAIGTALGGGWESGRGACDLMSDGMIEVQHMVRSHGILINNSVVVGRSVNDDALTALQSTATNICNSVGEADADSVADGDQPSICQPKPAP